jgi:SWI/SNF-related matrix-associated actin-dependent regulator of chromatin subfamily A-like protein 1
VKIAARGHGQYAFVCSYFSRALVEHAKAVPGMRWEGTSREWVGYPDACAAVAARLRANGLRLDTDELPAPEGWRSARSPFLFSTKGLREYQVDGVRFLIARSGEGALLADGMRLGKSCEAIVAARAFKQKTVVVCPSHVVGVWGREPEAPEGPGELAKWWPDAWLSEQARGEAAGEDSPGVLCLEGVRPDDEAKQRIAGAWVIVVSYDIVYAWVEILREWDLKTLIVDECHALQGRDSRRSAAVNALAVHARRRMFLSGTPMTSRPRDLHNVLDTLAPGRFGYFFTHQKPDGTVSGSFSRLFCAAHQKTVGKGPEAKTVWDFSGASNLSGKTLVPPAIVAEESLHARLSYLMLRRVKSEVDAQLPPKTRQIIDVKIPSAKMVTPTGSMLSDRGALRRCLDLSADGKMKHVVALLKQHAEEGEKVIGFCYRRLFAEGLCRDLARAGIECVYVHGGLSQAARDKRIQRMREHPGPCVLCATIDTTSTGIDLSFSSVAVFGELSWEPHELAQAEERVYKFGAGVSPLIQYVIARGTGDELIVRGVISKLDDFERAIGKTGDRMREDLSEGVRGEAALRRLAGALAEMQAATPEKKRKATRTKHG